MFFKLALWVHVINDTYMCTMKIVAKLISFEQIQPSKNLILETIKLLFYNTKKK